jgi:hypothetical protein
MMVRNMPQTGTVVVVVVDVLVEEVVGTVLVVEGGSRLTRLPTHTSTSASTVEASPGLRQPPLASAAAIAFENFDSTWARHEASTGTFLCTAAA